MNSPVQKQGAWVFLSHSHRDLAKVRRIRDELERRGHNPLIFFLKCMEDDSAELPDLLRREIEARHWFILCDSPNARASKWVQDEVAMIQSMEDKTFRTVDLSTDLESQLHKIVDLSKRATVYLSYNQSDAAIAQRMVDYLTDADYSVWSDGDVQPGMDNIREMQDALDDAIQRGFFLLLLSETSLKSRWCRYKIENVLAYAGSSHQSNIIPVIVDQFDYSEIPLALRPIPFFDLTAGSFEERMDELVYSLKNREME